jgi:hypothetical protein
MFQLPEKSVQGLAMQETLQDGAGKITWGCRLSKAGQLGGNDTKREQASGDSNRSVNASLFLHGAFG